jgi:hypothetical protein
MLESGTRRGVAQAQSREAFDAQSRQFTSVIHRSWHSKSLNVEFRIHWLFLSMFFSRSPTLPSYLLLSSRPLYLRNVLIYYCDLEYPSLPWECGNHVGPEMSRTRLRRIEVLKTVHHVCRFLRLCNGYLHVRPDRSCHTYCTTR